MLTPTLSSPRLRTALTRAPSCVRASFAVPAVLGFVAFALVAFVLVGASTSAAVGATTSALAQVRAEPRLSARLSAGITPLGSKVDLRIDVENVQRAQIVELPTVDGLAIGPAGQPSQQEYIGIVNGRSTMSRTLSWRIPVQPQREGTFEIGAVKLTVDGKALSTNPLSLTVVRDMKGEELGHIELVVDPPNALAGQPVSLELRFGWDEGVSRETNYAQLSLPWWGELPGLLERAQQPVDARLGRVNIPVAGIGDVACEELKNQSYGGRPFRMFRLRRDFIATRPGRVEFPTSTLEFGTTRDAGDFFNRRLEYLRRYYVRTSDAAIEIRALPESGRPASFSGAVGRFSARARAEPRDVDAGDSIKLEVEWSGAGNLEFFEPPDPLRMDAFKGFRVFGHTELDKSSTRRVVVYDLAPLSTDVKSIPPLPLSVYDTERGAYVDVTTEALSIKVRPLRDAAKLKALGQTETFDEDLRDIAAGLSPEPGARGGAPRPRVWLFALGACACAWIVLRTWVRRAGDPAAPAARARRRALRELERALAGSTGAEDDRRAWLAFLAQRSGSSAAAWDGRDVVRELSDARGGRLSATQAGALAEAMRRIDAAVWGKHDQRIARTELVRLAGELLEAGL